MSKLQNYFERQANRQMTLHPTAKEYSALLVLAIFGKIITMMLSVSGGVLYFVHLFFDFYLPLVVFLSGVLLLLIEGLNLYSLEKSLKMGLRSRTLPSVLLGVLSIVLFSISFFITTEGIRQWKAEATTKKTEISFNYQKAKEELKKDYSQRIARLQQAAEPLTKYAWKSKQVAVYTLKIDSLEKALALHLIQLEQKEQADQLHDKQHTEVKAETFYIIGVALMGGQLVFNVLIAVLYNRIHRETNQTQRIDEELNELRETRLGNFYGQIKTDFAGLETLFLQRLALAGDTKALALADNSFTNTATPETKPKTKVENETPPEIKQPDDKPQERPIGFQLPKPNESRIDASRNNESRINETRYNETRRENKTIKENTENEKVKYTKICPQCNTGFIHKHHLQKYCSEACRVKFWEQKTGRKLKYKKSK